MRAGGDWLAAAPAYDDARWGAVTDIRKGATTGELAIVGTLGAAFLPSKGSSSRFVAFRERAGFAQLLDSAPGQPRYLDRGGGGWQLGAVIREDGTRAWRPEDDAGMDDLAAGDLNGDGKLEFVAGYNGGGGVRCFDSSGKRLWRQDDGNVWHVEIVDTDADGKPEIVHSNAAGQLTVRDPNGNVVRRVHPDGYFSDFSIVEWPARESSVLYATDGHARIIDFSGVVRLQLETPDGDSMSEARGLPVRLGGREYLVVTESFSHWDRTQLFVFDGTGGLRYREVVASDSVTLGTDSTDAFLVGVGARVLRYELRPRVETPH